MNVSMSFILVILGCAVVTWIPRILPFTIVKNVELPKWFMRWLAYVPVCVLSALIFDSFFKEEAFLRLHIENILAFIPTVVIALWTKSLSLTVIVGIVTMAIIRLL